MSTENNAYNYTGDRPITEEKDDKLGFSALADQIALSLTQAKIEDGFVVGIEGEWGSGKSSLINLIKNKIEKEPDIIIVDFKPWLVGNRDILIDALFSEFVTALKEYFPYNEIAKNFKSFIKAAEDGFPKIKLLTATKYPVNRIIFFLKKINTISYSACIDIIIEFLYGITSEKSLSDLKNQLTTIFQDIDRRIIVVIDDLDRLDPSEAVEVLRLVRSVADFPNITYVLSYDRDILCKAIEEQIKIDSGQSYLEKIIQLVVPVPLPEYRELCDWFKGELKFILSPVGDISELLKLVITHTGYDALKSPRSLMKTLDSIRFYWPYFKENNLNFTDFIWLQLIKNKDPEFYHYIEKYCINLFNSIVDCKEISSENIDIDSKKINFFIKDCYNKREYNYIISQIVPSACIGSANEIILYQNDSNFFENIKNRRLASIDHYQLYFSPKNKPLIFSSKEIDEVLDTLEKNKADSDRILLSLHLSWISEHKNKGEIFLERINFEVYPMEKSSYNNMIISYSDIMDEIIENEVSKNTLFKSDREVYNFLSHVLPKFGKNERLNLIREIFEKGKSLGWISSLFHLELWAHGRCGDYTKPSSEWLFSNEELDEITYIMKKRYNSSSKEQIYRNALPITTMQTWQESGENEALQAFMQKHMESDEDFIETIECLVTKIIFNGQIIDVLYKSTLELLIEYEAYDNILSKIKSLIDDKFLGLRANNLLKANEISNNY